jgi:hypothetical protein
MVSITSWRTNFNRGQPAVLHRDDSVCRLGGILIVGNHHDQPIGAGFVSNVCEELQYDGSGRGVEISGGFVGEDQWWIHYQCAGDRYTLHLTTRKLRRSMVGTISKTNHFEQPQRIWFGATDRLAIEEPGNCNIFPSRHRRQQVEELEYETNTVPAELGLLVIVESADVVAIEANRPRIQGVERTK